MNTVSKHIKSLLFTNDCVIIPDFGGLVCNPHSASFNSLNNRFSPPYKALGFNSRLKNNDGLLAHEISIKENIDYKEASDWIQSFVSHLKDELKSTNEFLLGEIGTFYNDVNGNLRFKQNTKLPLDTNFFGLDSIACLPIPIEVNKKESNEKNPVGDLPKDSEKPIITLKEIPNKDVIPFPWKKLAIAACVLPFLFYLVWVGTSTSLLKENNQFQYSDLNPFTEKICNTYILRDKESALFELPPKSMSTLELIAEIGNERFIKHSFLESKDLELHSKNFIPIQVQNFEAVAFSTSVSNDRNLFAPRNERGFYIITGCFEFYENATKYVSDLRKKGLKAKIVDQKNGLFRISASSSNNRKSALKELDKIKSNGYPDAWVLSK